jgi:hypothetical protein
MARTRGNNGIIGQTIIPGRAGGGVIAAQDAAQDSAGGSWPGSVSTNIVYNQGGLSGNVNYYVAVANVVNTNVSYANTFGPAISEGFIVMYGTQFQANTIVIANGNTIPQANITYVSPSRLNVRLPNIANTVVLNIDAYNPVVNTGFAQQLPRYNIELLVVGGGGGAGSYAGGGGGGVVYAPVFTLVSGRNYTVSVGAGGAGSIGYPQPSCRSRTGNRGTPSKFTSSVPGPVVVEALGGGGGFGAFSPSFPSVPACAAIQIVCGGSGGGSNNKSTGTPGAATQPSYPQLSQGAAVFLSYGNSGGTTQSCNYGGGGGGAGLAGYPGVSGPATAGQGGDGIPISITGTAVYYGGGGGAQAPSGFRTGGLGGGGTGNNIASTPTVPALNGSPFGGGTPGLGGGGGANSGPYPPPFGVSTAFFPGGSGGSGVVILKIATPNFTGPGFAPGATVTTPPNAPGFTILTYPGPGTYIA